jgi:hypothetical protein
MKNTSFIQTRLGQRRKKSVSEVYEKLFEVDDAEKDEKIIHKE